MFDNLTYKYILFSIGFIYIILYIKDLLNSPQSISYFKDKLTILVVGSNSSFLNSTFYDVSKFYISTYVVYNIV